MHISPCALLIQQRQKKTKKQNWTNQGHLRTACQLLFLLAALSSMCAVEAHISTTSSSLGTQGISNYVLAAKICTVTTARPSCFSLSFLNNRGFAQSLEKLNPLWSFSATTWALSGGKIRTNPNPSSKKIKRAEVLCWWGNFGEDGWVRCTICCDVQFWDNLRRQLNRWHFKPRLSIIKKKKIKIVF